MTPLFQQIIREDMCAGRSITHLIETKCFDIDGIKDIVEEFMHRCKGVSVQSLHTLYTEMSFLPAPTCWFEWREDNGTRVGVLVSPHQAPGKHYTHAFHSRHAGLNNFIPLFAVDMFNFKSGDYLADVKKFPHTKPALIRLFRTLAAALAIINTPKIVGRREHAPHKGLVKNIRKVHGKAYQLRPWTEIKLEITPPPGGDGSREVLTGKKALHFCRAHLRIRRGKLERVTSHWRGDPALGIVRSRYSVNA